MKHLSDAEKWKILAEYDPRQAAGTLSAETKKKAEEIAEELGTAYMTAVVSQLGMDDAAEVLRSLPGSFREKVISDLPLDTAKALQEILSYPSDTAGALMSKDVLFVPLEATIQEATRHLQSISKERKTKVSYIYVVDGERRLTGVIQVRDLILYPPDKPVKDVLTFPVVQVETGMPQRAVAELLRRHRYLGLPVVDPAQRLAGVVSADSILQVMEEETSEDIARIVGTDAEEIKTHSVLTIMKLRLPWLLVSIASGLLCAFISGFFQQSIQTIAVLFLFVPVVLGLSESTGIQGATIVVRNLALGRVSLKDLGALFLREVAVGAAIGLVCGVIVGFAASFWKADGLLGLAVGSSMALAITVSGLIGLLLPVLFRHFKIDPAIASGPLVLAICDLQTLLVYFGVAGIILS